MNVSVTSVLLPKAKNLAESDKIDSVVPTISHSVNFIRGLVIEVCCMKLCKDFLISVILETHDVLKLEPITNFDHLVKLRLLLLLHLILINILHLDDLGFLGCKNDNGIKVGMKLILESIMNAQIFVHC